MWGRWVFSSSFFVMLTTVFKYFEGWGGGGGEGRGWGNNQN